MQSAALVKALTWFAPPLNDQVILAIYALRCAFVHNYGLVNRSAGRKNSRLLNHCFLLIDDPLSPLVAIPDPPWDGNWSTARPSTKTKINVRALGDLAESIVRELYVAQQQRRLTVVLEGGVDELFARFAMTVNQTPEQEEWVLLLNTSSHTHPAFV